MEQMLSIQDFSQCPRYSWIGSYFDELDSTTRCKMHLIIVTALLVHDGISIDQVADMFLLQRNRLAKAVPRLKKEALIYDGGDGRLYIRGERTRFLWPRGEGMPTDEYLTDYDILSRLLNDLKRREEAAYRAKSKDDPTASASSGDVTQVQLLQQSTQEPMLKETLELQNKLSHLLLKFEQNMRLKRNASGSTYVVNVESSGSGSGKKVANTQVANHLKNVADDDLRTMAVDVMQYIGKTSLITICNGYCLVCLSALEEPHVLTKCGHVLCGKCMLHMEKRSTVSKLVECPSCRALNRSHKLYM